MRRIAVSFVLACVVASAALAQSQFKPPKATLQYAPDRVCDLLNVSLDIDVDYAGRTIKGHVVNTLAALGDNVESVDLQAGKALDIRSVSVDGKPVNFNREGMELRIPTPKLKKGQKVDIAIDYAGTNLRGRTFGAGGGGWHWISTRNASEDPNRVGFWTQGETEGNRDWVPTWDYPNDFATTETRTTVPADWSVVGNGSLVSEKLDSEKKRKTYVWRMTQPHATYLLSLAGGPFDIKRDKWEGVDLWYVVPKGLGSLIDDSFGDTKDMLSFYSDVLGVKYPWPKYAQNAMNDFGGGMENVSATTLGADALTEAREGFRNMASLNAHELAHQWFGDLVTCIDWGETWLNESFATYMEAAYMEHSRGPNGYAMSIDGDMRGYFGEARRYKRPLSTRLYSKPDDMFDSHAYPKGATVLHTLRRQIGDQAFYGGLNLYLTRHRHSPVESTQLCRAFTDASGINCAPFFDQWVFKPGHPVLDTTWKQEGGKVLLSVKQTQSTDDGTPIYRIPAKVGIIDETGKIEYRKLTLSKADETFELVVQGPVKALLFDPNHDFLREIPDLHWSAAELPFIAKVAPDCTDRQEAVRRLMADEPSSETLKLVVDLLTADKGAFPAFPYVASASKLAKPEFRAFWLGQLDHPNFGRRSTAVSQLAELPQDKATIERFRALITPGAPLSVVTNAIDALAQWDAKGNADVFKRASSIYDRRGRIQRSAKRALEKSEGK